jgi:hypothetical protein
MGRPPLCRTAMTKTQIQRPWRRNVKRIALEYLLNKSVALITASVPVRLGSSA